MFFLGLVLMWFLALILYLAREIPACVFSCKNIFLWSVIHLLVFAVLLKYTTNSAYAFVAAVYLVTTAMIDYHVGFVYTMLSYLAILVCIVFLLQAGCTGNIFCHAVFFLYLKALELLGVFGGGDTQYLMFLYCFNHLVKGEAAENLMIVILLFSIALHMAWHRGQYGKLKPFTPAILAAAVVVFMILS